MHRRPKTTKNTGSERFHTHAGTQCFNFVTQRHFHLLTNDVLCTDIITLIGQLQRTGLEQCEALSLSPGHLSQTSGGPLRNNFACCNRVLKH